MDYEDPEKRIAELERQLAAQKRIAELERQLAEARAVPHEDRVAKQPPQSFDAQAIAGHHRGQGRPQDVGALAGVKSQPAFPGETDFGGKAGFRSQRRQRRGIGLVAIPVIAGLWGVVAGVNSYIPSSALWMSGIVCSSPYHLEYSTSHYSYNPAQSGTSVSFQCVNGASSYDVNDFAIVGLQVVLAVLVLCGAVAVGRLMRRLLRKPK